MTLISTTIAMSSARASLSLASGKIDSIMALRRDIERLAESFGGKVAWKDSADCDPSPRQGEAR